MLDETSSAKFKVVSLSSDTFTRCICVISSDIEDQLINKMKDTRFALQVDELSHTPRSARIKAD